MTIEQLAIPTPGRRIRRTPPGLREDDLLERVRRLARVNGWRLFHVYDSRKAVGAGFPDCVLVHDRQRRVIFAELKRPGADPTPKQVAWLAALRAAGCEVAVWRPADLDDIRAVLRGRRIDQAEHGIEPLTP
jgi:VRR-NUC domain-containing protein